MLLDRTISQLDIGPVPPDRALEMGRMGYMQWLGALPGRSDYMAQARRALVAAEPFAGGSPAVQVFCDLLTASMQMPPVPLPLSLPERRRRGGRRARRMTL